MIDVFVSQPDGTVITQPDGTPIIAYSYQPTPPLGVDYKSADFAGALQRLLPRGRAWPREPDAVMSQVVAALAPGLARLHARANRLVEDGFPASTLGLLPEWEATLGLPDPCAGEHPTLQERRAQVLARIGARGGQSVPYMVGFAASLGIPITVTEFAPSRLGTFRLGQRLRSAAWANAWRVTAPATTFTYFRLGRSALGERLRSWGSAVLECELRRIAPAHTTLRFAYAGITTTAGWDRSSGWDKGGWA